MATLIFIDKENEGDVGAAPKDRLRLSSVSSKVLSERSQIQTPLVGRTANATPARSQSVRKALGNVNRTLGTTNKKEIRKQKKQALPSKETTGKTTQVESCSVAAEEAYPEIENFFPFNPLDFESLEVPEEHKLSHMSLTGAPLLIFDKNIPDRCINMVPSPVKLSHISWECELLQSTANFLSTLDEIIDLPPLSDDS
ncbi:securin isoform X1 [Dermochelys coriacea]|uniref:securin isoform X1 n=1 Tax=Dermochelys coriacea TaxID=27794 RepID=UPI0018E896EE|nr:securin isoform X1 [Dermochelys coriacea]XP_038269174.1 securin isoform X1 [Dermochelys coriacea]